MRKNNNDAKDVMAIERRFNKPLLVSAVAAAACMSVAHAQEAGGPATVQELEEVTVTGTRATIQTTIDIKRNSITIVDGLSANEIGELPALSIGEALESVTGASSHRENGGATEISIRGLGPYLSASTFNGREATNGSGDRSVNFSQFPSELMNKVAIYKTQDASLVEGGVAGLIALETLKPLEYGKRRIQIDTKANYNPDQSNIDDPMAGNLGFRGTASYVDQFEFDNGMAFGVSLGYQKSDISQPEAEIRSSSPSGSSLYACLNDPDIASGFYREKPDDCNKSGGTFDTEVNPETGNAYSDDSAFAFAPSSNGYRQNDTSDKRDSVFVALQFQPSEKMDINFDLQQSARVQSEQRHDLNFANMRRVTPGLTAESLIVSENGAVSEWAGETAIESNSEVYSRTEDYLGYGLNVAYDFTENLTVSADVSFSETTREELQVSVRTQSDKQNIAGEETQGGYRPLVSWTKDSGILQYTVNDFDVTDHTLFSDAYRVRIDNDVDRRNTINAFRTDFDWKLDSGFVTSLQGGLRFSELEYLDLGADREEYSLSRGSEAGAATIADINKACAIPFPERDFLDGLRDGNLVTNIDSATGTATTGTGNSWATFDTMCVTNMILSANGAEFSYPELKDRNTDVTDVAETTTAGYVMANFESSLLGKAVYGNFGVRVVKTDVESVAYRAPYEILTHDSGALSLQPIEDADPERVTSGGDYTEVLPSFNLVADVSESVLLRGAVYRGLSRPDPSDLGYKRTFKTTSSKEVTNIDELIEDVSGSGNPNMKPLTSWNFDAAIEWYPNEDTLLAFGIYHKKFQGGFEQARTTESFVVDGQTVEADFTTTRANEDTNDLNGIEITGAHRFSYLPGYLSGLGIKASYNHADSDFKFEDSRYGSVTILADDGSVHSQTQGIIAPGNVPGFSENVFSGQLYYQIGNLDTSIIYKYRSEYFQPYTSNGTRLRYVGDVGVWEARASYRVNENLKLSLEAINLFDEPKKQYFFTNDNLGEVNSYGPRVFLGLKAKF
ncbi:TonB-dependent receptor [uncultured Microbulbifer sp.]|uniref:TonB-dependent receptor n=1 Tax=uncultured Microbulbifer sp. TaxID=348147 RepID=UPI002624BB78|nr:TonB-dependent receptor [uncultured Microbulbifer sp.]